VIAQADFAVQALSQIGKPTIRRRRKL